MNNHPFFPNYTKTQSNAVTATAQTFTNLPANCNQLLLSNVGTQVVFVRVTESTSTAAATSSDMPVLPNDWIIISKDGGQSDGSDLGFSRLSYIAGATGSTLYVTPGNGHS